MQSLKNFSKKLLKLYKEDFSGINLTRILDEEDFFNKQILDSVYPFVEYDFIKNLLGKYELVIDIGFGGGFPLLPLAEKFPDNFFIGLEARGKKAKVVQEISQIMNLENVKTFHQRSEDLIIDLPCLITFKAVGTVQLCIDRLNCYEDVTVLFYKGPDYKNEEKDLMLDETWSVLKKEFFELPHGEKRTIVILQKKVPRGTLLKNKSNRLKKLSDIIVDTER